MFSRHKFTPNVPAVCVVAESEVIIVQVTNWQLKIDNVRCSYNAAIAHDRVLGGVIVNLFYTL